MRGGDVRDVGATIGPLLGISKPLSDGRKLGHALFYGAPIPNVASVARTVHGQVVRFGGGMLWRGRNTSGRLWTVDEKGGAIPVESSHPIVVRALSDRMMQEMKRKLP